MNVHLRWGGSKQFMPKWADSGWLSFWYSHNCRTKLRYTDWNNCRKRSSVAPTIGQRSWRKLHHNDYADVVYETNPIDRLQFHVGTSIELNPIRHCVCTDCQQPETKASEDALATAVPIVQSERIRQSRPQLGWHTPNDNVGRRYATVCSAWSLLNSVERRLQFARRIISRRIANRVVSKYIYTTIHMYLWINNWMGNINKTRRSRRKTHNLTHTRK